MSEEEEEERIGLFVGRQNFWSTRSSDWSLFFWKLIVSCNRATFYDLYQFGNRNLKSLGQLPACHRFALVKSVFLGKDKQEFKISYFEELQLSCLSLSRLSSRSLEARESWSSVIVFSASQSHFVRLQLGEGSRLTAIVLRRKERATPATWFISRSLEWLCHHNGTEIQLRAQTAGVSARRHVKGAKASSQLLLN